MTADAAVQRGRATDRGAPTSLVARQRTRTCVAGHFAAVALVVASGGVGWSLASSVAAGASTNSTLQAQAASIVSTINRDTNDLNKLGENYLGQYRLYEMANAQARALKKSIAVTVAAVSRDRLQVVDAAVSAYVSAGSDSDLSFFLDGSVNSLPTGETYLRAAADRLDDATLALESEQHALANALTSEQRVANDAHLALSTTISDRTTVLVTVRHERALLSSVRGQLATLVHEEEIAAERARARAEAAQARAAAEAAAQRAAQAKAAKATTVSTSSSPAPTSSSGASGPPAPNGVPPAATSPIPAGTLSQDFAGIRNCESGDRYYLDTGNGYYGAYQFSVATWQGLGEPGLPNQSPPALQDATAYRLYLGAGWGSWPECAALLGLT